MEETGTFKWLLEQCLRPISIAIPTLMLNTALPGCRDVAPQAESPQKPAVSETPDTNKVTDNVITTPPVALDSFDLPTPAAPAQRPIQRQI